MSTGITKLIPYDYDLNVTLGTTFIPTSCYPSQGRHK